MEAPFLQTVAPNGSAWWEYVRGAAIFVDQGTGLLRGPWAECICYGVLFEYSEDWEALGEYDGTRPVRGVLTALASALEGRDDAQPVADAAQRLEQAAQHAAESGQPLPVIGYAGAPVPPTAFRPHPPPVLSAHAGNGSVDAALDVCSMGQPPPPPLPAAAERGRGGPTLLGSRSSEDSKSKVGGASATATVSGAPGRGPLSAGAAHLLRRDGSGSSMGSAGSGAGRQSSDASRHIAAGVGIGELC